MYIYAHTHTHMYLLKIHFKNMKQKCHFRGKKKNHKSDLGFVVSVLTLTVLTPLPQMQAVNVVVHSFRSHQRC